jgi:signal transduction histidine kinase
MEEAASLAIPSIPNIERYLLIMRWTAVAMGVLLSFFAGFANPTPLPLPLSASLIVIWNGLLSVYSMRCQPFAAGHPRALLIADAAQAGLATLLMGGYHNTFFALFLLLVVELALALPFRLAIGWIFTAGALHVAAAVLNPMEHWSALGAYMTTGRLLILLVVGALAIAFSEQIRREEQSRQMALEHAQQLTLLNELFFQLNQPLANVEEAFTVLLHGAQRLLRAEMGMVLVCDTALGCWKLMIGNGTADVQPSTIGIADLGWPAGQQEIFTAGPAYQRPLPRSWAARGLRAVAGIRLNAPSSDEPWVLLIGRRDQLNPEEWLLMRALAREAELALRNAHLYASEHAQVLRLQEFEQTRQSFLASVAHELRTPLTVLHTLLPSFGMWGQLTPTQQTEMMSMVDQNLERLESLIGDFLESTRLEAGMVTLHREPLDLARRAQRALDTLQPLFRARQQQVALDAPPALPLVDGDRRRVDQILSSLLHNATKFTPVGGTIRLVLQRDGAAVRVCVEDNGPGVPFAVREHLFEKFYSAPVESALAGVGLGLYICRELVALHGGRLWYEERTGGGSRFCFTMPVAEAQDGEGDKEDSGH